MLNMVSCRFFGRLVSSFSLLSAFNRYVLFLFISLKKQKTVKGAKYLSSQSRFSETNKVSNVGIIANFVFPCICSFYLYLHQLMLANVKLQIKGCMRISILWLHILLDQVIFNGRAKMNLEMFGILELWGVYEKLYRILFWILGRQSLSPIILFGDWQKIEYPPVMLRF